jgi:hypothetical protein
MRRQWLAVGVMVVASGLAACSGGSDDKPETMPAKTSSAPAVSTPAPTPTTPTQPQGAYGVTYEIQTWDQYASDPAVLAWKQTLEAVSGSTNSGKVLEPVRAGMAKTVLRAYVGGFEDAWDGGWSVQPVGKVKIESADTSASKSRLVTCLWSPTTALYKKNGEPVGGGTVEDLAGWSKQKVEMRSRDGRWVITKVDFDGDCSGGAPS